MKRDNKFSDQNKIYVIKMPSGPKKNINKGILCVNKNNESVINNNKMYGNLFDFI